MCGHRYDEIADPNTEVGRHFAENEYIVEFEHPMLHTTHKAVGVPTNFSATPAGQSSPLLVPLPAVSWPWVLAWGSLEPSRRAGENAQKTRKNGGKMGEIPSKRCGETGWGGGHRHLGAGDRGAGAEPWRRGGVRAAGGDLPQPECGDGTGDRDARVPQAVARRGHPES